MTHKLKVKTYPNRPERTQPAVRPEFEGQHKGEVVNLVFRQHPVVMRMALIKGLVILLIAIGPLFIWSSTSLVDIALLYTWSVWIFAGGIVVVVLSWALAWIKWYYSVFILTSERLFQIHQLGLFKREVDSLFHARIHAVNYNIDGIQGAVLGFGTISIQTEVGNYFLKNVPHPAKLHEQILEAVRDHIGEDD